MIEAIDTYNLFNQTGGSFDTDLNKRVFMATGGEFNLLELFRKVFGYRGLPFGPVRTDKTYSTVNQESEIKTIGAKDGLALSALGTPVFQPLKFVDYFGKDKSQLDPFVFPIEPLITVTGEKRIVETVSAGGSQEVIEHIATGHFKIKIQGLFVNMEQDAPPQDDLRKLLNYYALRRAIAVENEHLGAFGIQYMAIKGASWPVQAGEIGIQAFEINGRSDKPVILELK